MVARGIFISLVTALFAIFPLTDTDIWWHLACAREWVTTWTPVREPVVNVHEYFQHIVGYVYALGGAPLLVVFKALSWGVVFALFVRPGKWMGMLFVTYFLFIFRFHLEMRPVLFSLLFLGIYWNVLPGLFARAHSDVKMSLLKPVTLLLSVLILAVQWFWCKCQGLFILGPLFATLVLFVGIWNSHKSGMTLSRRKIALCVTFVLALFAMPFLHKEGLNLFLYPFGLLDRLLGLSPSAAVFASEIAENRSPFTLLMAGENVLESMLMILSCMAGMGYAIYRLYRSHRPDILGISLIVMSILALIAERNFIILLPFLLLKVGTIGPDEKCQNHFLRMGHVLIPAVFLAFLLGLWARSLSAYDYAMVAYQRIPVGAARWMSAHPHHGRLFNDDRAGGYLEFMNPADPVYIDGRFILKTAEFFGHYLEFSNNPALFLQEADSLGIDRAVFPLRYYARWEKLLNALDSGKKWHLKYRDDYFSVYDRNLGL
ncbi:hypothetical protein [uncultured Fibrobacter sp.]|uniref:hypothetical protein n=1 Tax=uncultured Fibrobacter sp. TaxID=261512 RepID=UPI00263589DE|nr:hypothetical protein [uncultured Fibrobacter sp.]